MRVPRNARAGEDGLALDATIRREARHLHVVAADRAEAEFLERNVGAADLLAVQAGEAHPGEWHVRHSECALREAALREPALRKAALCEPALCEAALREPGVIEADLPEIALREA